MHQHTSRDTDQTSRNHKVCRKVTSFTATYVENLRGRLRSARCKANSTISSKIRSFTGQSSPSSTNRPVCAVAKHSLGLDLNSINCNKEDHADWSESLCKNKSTLWTRPSAFLQMCKMHTWILKNVVNSRNSQLLPQINACLQPIIVTFQQIPMCHHYHRPGICIPSLKLVSTLHNLHFDWKPLVSTWHGSEALNMFLRTEKYILSKKWSVGGSDYHWRTWREIWRVSVNCHGVCGHHPEASGTSCAQKVR